MTFPKMSRGHSPDLQSRGYVLHLLGIKSPLCFLKSEPLFLLGSQPRRLFKNSSSGQLLHVRKDDIWRRIRRFSAQSCAVSLEQSMGARNRLGVRLSYRPARLNKLTGGYATRLILGSLPPQTVLNYQLRARICKPFKEPWNPIPSLAGRYDNPIS